jgi:hypothetical protein
VADVGSLGDVVSAQPIGDRDTDLGPNRHEDLTSEDAREERLAGRPSEYSPARAGGRCRSAL